MKNIIPLCVVVAMFGCANDDGPVGPTGPGTSDGTPHETNPAPGAYSFDFTGYAETLEPGYVKTYSDGSWNRYAGKEVVNGTTYLAVDADNGARYYYTLVGGRYAGCRPPGESAVIFDAPQPMLPAGWNLYSTIVLSVNFSYGGYSVSAKTSYRLIDTAQAVTVLGSFAPVAHFTVQVDMTSSSGDASTTIEDLWVARGPGEIRFRYQGTNTAEFVYGYVNGRSWGTPPGVHKRVVRTVSLAEALVQGVVR